MPVFADPLQGDADAWRQFLRLYGPVVYGWCRHAGLQPADATDVGQEVFVAAYGHGEEETDDHLHLDLGEIHWAPVGWGRALSPPAIENWKLEI